MSDTTPREPTAPLDDATFRRLRTYNGVMAVLHAGQAVVMLVLANDFGLEVGSFSTGGPPGTPLEEGTMERLFELPLAIATAGFLLLSAVFHLVVATPPGVRAYRRELERGRNRFRWVEYSLSATTMIVLIALVTGVVDVAALIGLAFANAAMILFGWLMEVGNPPDRTRTWWTPFWFGCVAGIGPWIAIAVSLGVNVSRSDEGPPGFVWGILVSIFVFFNSFAVNQWLQYRRVGPWRRYTFGEAVYVLLSLTSKSALAWQVFANTLIA